MPEAVTLTNQLVHGCDTYPALCVCPSCEHSYNRDRRKECKMKKCGEFQCYKTKCYNYKTRQVKRSYGANND